MFSYNAPTPKIEKTGFEYIDHSPQSKDLAPSDYYFLNRKIFLTDDEVKYTIEEWFDKKIQKTNANK